MVICSYDMEHMFYNGAIQIKWRPVSGHDKEEVIPMERRAQGGLPTAGPAQQVTAGTEEQGRGQMSP